MREDTDLEVARYGLRTFNVERGNGIGSYPRGLRSLFKMTYWENGVMEAECLRDRDELHFLYRMAMLSQRDQEAQDLYRHKPPYKDCHCGVYATLTLDHLLEQYYPQVRANGVAVVAAEGTTIIGDKGMRTTAARIVAYWCPNRKLRRVYREVCGEDVPHYSHMDKMLEAYRLPPLPPQFPNALGAFFWRKDG